MTTEKKTSDVDFLMKAMKFATQKHQLQRRKAGGGNIPYIIHPVTVSEILSNAGVTDVEVLAAALLHDTIEDTETTKEELLERFGERVTRMVLDCSDDKSLHWIARKKEQIRHAATLQEDSQLVKIADKIANLEDILNNGSPWGAERTWGYFVWAGKVVDGIKNTIPSLRERFNKAFEGQFVGSDGVTYPALPKDRTREEILEAYFKE